MTVNVIRDRIARIERDMIMTVNVIRDMITICGGDDMKEMMMMMVI